MELIHQIRQAYDVHGYQTKLLAASTRHPKHMLDCLLAGADVATVPYNVIEGLLKHPLTESGIAKFLADYAKAFS